MLNYVNYGDEHVGDVRNTRTSNKSVYATQYKAQQKNWWRVTWTWTIQTFAIRALASTTWPTSSWKTESGEYIDIYPDLLEAFERGQAPKRVFITMVATGKFGSLRDVQKIGLLRDWVFRTFFGIHPLLYQPNRPDLIERYKGEVPLDEYPKRCVEQIADWKRDRFKI